MTLQMKKLKKKLKKYNLLKKVKVIWLKKIEVQHFVEI